MAPGSSPEGGLASARRKTQGCPARRCRARSFCNSSLTVLTPLLWPTRAPGAALRSARQATPPPQAYRALPPRTALAALARHASETDDEEDPADSCRAAPPAARGSRGERAVVDAAGRRREVRSGAGLTLGPGRRVRRPARHPSHARAGPRDRLPG